MRRLFSRRRRSEPDSSGSQGRPARPPNAVIQAQMIFEPKQMGVMHSSTRDYHVWASPGYVTFGDSRACHLYDMKSRSFTVLPALPLKMGLPTPSPNGRMLLFQQQDRRSGERVLYLYDVHAGSYISDKTLPCNHSVTIWVSSTLVGIMGSSGEVLRWSIKGGDYDRPLEPVFKWSDWSTPPRASFSFGVSPNERWWSAVVIDDRTQTGRVQIYDSLTRMSKLYMGTGCGFAQVQQGAGSQTWVALIAKKEAKNQMTLKTVPLEDNNRPTDISHKLEVDDDMPLAILITSSLAIVMTSGSWWYTVDIRTGVLKDSFWTPDTVDWPCPTVDRNNITAVRTSNQVWKYTINQQTVLQMQEETAALSASTLVDVDEPQASLNLFWDMYPA